MSTSTVLRRAALVAVAGLLLALAPASAARAAGEFVTVSAPLADAALTGSTDVTFSASLDPAGDVFPAAAQVTLDATAVPGAVTACPGTTVECAGTLTFDATGFSGAHELVVELVDVDGNALWASDPLRVQGILPVAQVTGPAAGIVIGPVTVTASGDTDPGLAEHVATVEIRRGAESLGTAVCPADVHHCEASLDWDATGVVGDQALSAVVTTDLGRTVVSAVVTMTPSNPVPEVAVVAPLPADPVTGTVQVTATATTDPLLSEYPATVALFRDGATPVGAAKTCPGAVSSCTVTFDWDATGLPSPQTLTAVVTTDRGRTATSAPLTRAVSNPAPHVAVASPAAASTVSGSTVVGVEASTDPAVSDYPASVTLYAGATVVGTADCPQPQTSRTCAASFPWDTSGPDRSAVLSARVTTTRGASADSAPTTVAIDNPEPAVTITSPVTASTQVGLVTVDVSASTDASLTDVPQSIELLDGTSSLGVRTCASARTCDVTFTWDGTATSASLALSAVVTTTLGVRAPSVPVAVTVVDVAPAVTITSPAANAVVSGSAVPVAVTAATDPGRTDVPQTLALLVDGVTRSTATCAGGHTCTATLPWNATRSAGPHSVRATMMTTRGSTAGSATRVLNAVSASRVVLSTPRVVRAGATLTIRGTVLATTSGLGVPGVRVTVTRKPALGSATTVRVTTGAGGVFTLSYVARSNAVVSAVTTRTAWLGSSSASTSIRASAPMSCAVANRSLRVGAVGKGSCFVAALPVGTGLALRYVYNGRTATLASGRSRSSTIPFSFGFPRRGTYYLRVDLVASSVYVASRSALMKVTVG